MEAAAAALAVELWLVARKRPVTRRRLWAAYGGLAALTLMATLLVFLLPGLLAFDVVRRRVATDGDRWLRRALAAGVGAVAGLHYLFFLAPQSRLVTGTEGFSAMYAPFSSGATPTLRFVREAGLWFLRLPTSAGFLPPDVYEGEVDLSAALWPPVSRVAMAGVAVALAFGVVATRRRADLRPVPVALALALVVQLVVSGDERWPFGANPTNLFLLPLMAFLIAAGIAWMAGHARHSRTLTVLVCGVSLAIAAAVPLQAARLAQLRRDGAGYPLFVGLRDAVVQVRGTAGPTDVVVVSSPPRLPPGAFAGWDYYMHRYDGLPAPARDRPAVPRARTLLVTDPDEPLRAFLARPAERPGRIFLLELWNFTEAQRSVRAVQRLHDEGVHDEAHGGERNVALGRAGRSTRVDDALVRLQDTTAEIRVRIAVALLIGFVALAAHSGLETILGAFVAGALLGTVDRNTATHPHFRLKLEALGYGFVIPVFFVASGLRFDLDALTADPSAVARVPLFLLALLLVRAVPALVYRRTLDRREVAVAGLLQATSLPFIVTATEIGVSLGAIDEVTAAALVSAGLLSVVALPPIALALLQRQPSAAEA